MSGWTGLTDPDRHETNRDGESAYCTECWDTHCSQELPCKCCGKAEVERLTFANKVLQYGLRQSCADSLNQRERIAAALAECERHLTDGFVLTWKIERILRGES